MVASSFSTVTRSYTITSWLLVTVRLPGPALRHTKCKMHPSQCCEERLHQKSELSPAEPSGLLVVEHVGQNEYLSPAVHVHRATKTLKEYCNILIQHTLELKEFLPFTKNVSNCHLCPICGSPFKDISVINIAGNLRGKILPPTQTKVNECLSSRVVLLIISKSSQWLSEFRVIGKSPFT